MYWTVINGARRRRRRRGGFLTGSPPIWKRVSRDYVYFLYVTLYTVYRGDTRPGCNNTETFYRPVELMKRSGIFICVSDRCKSCGKVISLPLTVIYSLRHINISEWLQSQRERSSVNTKNVLHLYIYNAHLSTSGTPEFVFGIKVANSGASRIFIMICISAVKRSVRLDYNVYVPARFYWN